MKTLTDDPVVCWRCQELPQEDEELMICLICRRPFCSNCSVADYGREFCSTRCREMFFYGDGDGSDEE